MDNYKVIRRKIEQFIRKYYINQIIKGSLITLSAVGVMILLFVLPEAQFYFSQFVRTVLFFVFLLAALILSGIYIFLPAFRLFHIKKGLNRYDAARIIGKHFDEVSDKLINVIQLEDQINISDKETELLRASIEQRSKQLSGIPFKEAVDYSKNKKYLVRFGAVIVLLFALFISFPETFQQSAGRIVSYQKTFEKPQPFYFEIVTDSLEAIQNKDFTLRFKTSGDKVPGKVYIQWQGNRVHTKKVSQNLFEHTFKGLNQDRTFRLTAGNITSDDYKIRVRPLPIILEFDIHMDYPEYTGKQNETIKNSGDIFAPEGTRVEWSFYTRDLFSFYFKTRDSTAKIEKKESNKFVIERELYNDFEYKVFGSNQFLSTQDTVSYQVNVIEDQFPEISVEQEKDSISLDRRYFTGIIQDDYGLSSLLFHTEIIKRNDTTKAKASIDIPSNAKQRFYYSTTFDTLQLKGGDVVRYYFEVFDNDKVNGHKSAQSRIFTYKQPTQNEIAEKSQQSHNKINKDLNQNVEEARKLEKRLEDIRSDMMNKKKLNWDDKKKLKEAMKDLEDLKKDLKEIRKNSEANRKFEEQFDESDKELLQKQKELEDLMDKVLNEEVKKLMDEIRKMMEEMDKDKMNELLDKMEESNESMKSQLERSIEMFKQLQFQKNLDKAIKKTEELTEKQKELEEETQDSRRKDLDEISEEEKNLKRETDSLSKELDSLEKLDKELENPNRFKAPNSDMQNIQKDMQKSIQELQNKNKNKAGDKMKKAGDKLFQLSQKMKRQQKQMKKERLAEDIDNLKQILENLVEISFEQESLISNFKSTNKNDPKYVEKIQEQFELKEKLEKVKDSLTALSKRQTMIKPFVMKEIESIDDNLEKSLEHLKERDTRSGRSRQQYVMTHVNNLSLMLAEALENMQQNMSSMGSSSGKSGKKQSVPKMSEIRKMQEKLQKQMQEMKEGMKKGKKQGKKSGMSEKVARMAAKQAAIRRKLQQYRKELMKQGKGDQGLNKTIEKMDENESDMVNKRITEELIKRQEKIVSRLLESEKAERKQDKKKEREAEQAKSYKKRNPKQFLEYKEIETNSKEVLKTIPPEMHPYYRKKVNDYFIEEKTQKNEREQKPAD
ncbi:MAG: hypothetical protein K9I47_08125 [Bacteroidales bacterium]|nr:hypothetical protein [Bacteroidales bacterium]